MKKNIVDALIGSDIQEIRIMSFFINSKLICEAIALYVGIEDGRWCKFTSSDGTSNIEMLLEEPELSSLDSIKDEFAYPIKVILNNYQHSRIVDIKEYLWMEREDESVGFYVELEDNKGFSLFDNDDCLNLTEGIRIEQGYTLVSCR